MRGLQTIAFFIALFAVGGKPAYSQREVPKDMVITLERTMCFGWCPAYNLTISGDGTVRFVPTAAYVYRGDGVMPSFPLTGKLTTDELKVLSAEFEKIRFYSLSNRYGRAGKSKGGPLCPEYWTDSPSAYVSIVKNGNRKSVSHYLGCHGTRTLDALEALEDKIDKIANTEQWTSQFGWNMANVVDLKLQVNRSNSTKPDKP